MRRIPFLEATGQAKTFWTAVFVFIAMGATLVWALLYAKLTDYVVVLIVNRLALFIGEDPLGVSGGANLFAYADNIPTLFTDPLGLKPSQDLVHRRVEVQGQ